ncbi:MAG TPA: hypothetical protein VJ873_06105 [bacterium]|nr:hypothetical protein [bacterium]
MAEYLLTPEKNQQPSAFELMEELHRRSVPVEIHLKGQDKEWESIRFFESGPPEIECYLFFDGEKGTYSTTVSQDAPRAAVELQVYLVDTLLQTLGGQVDNLNTRERFTPQQFALKVKHHHDPSAEKKELVWIAFSWGVVLLALMVYFMVPSHLQQLVIVILVLSFLSAALQTYSHFQHG